MDKLELLKRADDLLKFILTGLEQGKEFAVEQAPLVVKEVITWGIVSSAIGVAIGCGLLIFAVVALRICVKQSNENWGFAAFMTGLPGTLTTLFFLPIMLKAIYAPRLYLLDQLKELFR
mgnify:CR=1 FL=1